MSSVLPRITVCHPDEGRDPIIEDYSLLILNVRLVKWIPAFAGMTLENTE